MSYRKFWLQVGENKYDLVTDAFLHDPNGLGFRKNYTSYMIGTKEVVTSQNYVLPTIAGDIIFFKGSRADKYRDYQEFLQFIRAEEIKLYYHTPNTFDNYYCEGIITEVNKTEVKPNGLLTCPFVFKATTTWRNAQARQVITKNTPTAEEGKYYDLTRDYAYASGSFDNIELENRGFENVGFIMEVKGTCTNPKLSLSQNGVQYGVVQIMGEYDYVYINSKDGEEEIRLERNGVAVTNPISYQNMALADGIVDVTFLKLKNGKTNAIFTPYDFAGELVLSWYDSYVSV